MLKIVELTKENENQYLDQIAELEQITLDAMEKEGREGQLFPTGKESISEYVHSESNTVLVSTDETGKVEAATYIKQGQLPFSYYDITKYFKYGENYKQYVKAQYPSIEEYHKTMLRMYTIKVRAFEYARKQILKNHPEVGNIQAYLEQELELNGFDEKSELREMINTYMFEYIAQSFGDEIIKKYEQFYWTTTEDIFEETGKQCNMEGEDVVEYEAFLQAQSDYEAILKQQSLVIHEIPEFQENQYYSANTSNSVELDTYLTSPNSRHAGTARILVFEGIKKHINRYFSNPENKEIFLCSTLHRDNFPSKYVSEFFGLTDSLYVKRRQGRNREVHICRIPREQALEYLVSTSDKLAVLYGYNPSQKNISTSTRLKVLREQLDYEKREHARLETARSIDKNFSGPNLKIIGRKARKINSLQQQIQTLEMEMLKEDKGEQ